MGMKSGFCVFFLLPIFLAKGQGLSALVVGQDNHLEFTAVVQAEGNAKLDLYFKVKEWMKTDYKKIPGIYSNIEITEDNRSQFKVSAQERILLNIIYRNEAVQEILETTLTIEIREGRYKYSFTNMTFDYKNCRIEDFISDKSIATAQNPSLNIEYKKSTILAIDKMIESLITKLAQVPVNIEW
jgi:hypothetical protein